MTPLFIQCWHWNLEYCPLLIQIIHTLSETVFLTVVAGGAGVCPISHSSLDHYRSETQTLSHVWTSPVDLMCMILDCGRKSEHPAEAHPDMGRTWRSKELVHPYPPILITIISVKWSGQQKRSTTFNTAVIFCSFCEWEPGQSWGKMDVWEGMKEVGEKRVMDLLGDGVVAWRSILDLWEAGFKSHVLALSLPLSLTCGP